MSCRFNRWIAEALEERSEHQRVSMFVGMLEVGITQIVDVDMSGRGALAIFEREQMQVGMFFLKFAEHFNHGRRILVDAISCQHEQIGLL